MQRPSINFITIIRSIAITFFAGVLFLSISANVFAAVGINRQINFQGKLVDGNGLTVADSTYSIIFSFYNVTSGGTALWTETDSVTTVGGIFRVSLGAVTPIPANFNFNWDGLYLGIKISTEASEMTPRITMAAVPFAFNAQQVAGLTVQDENGNASTSGTLKIPNTKTVSFAGASSFGAGTTGLVTLGSATNALTLTTSGDTTLALPTSGTLITNSAAANQTITSTQTSGTVLGITDISGTAASTGLAITLTGSGAVDQTGLSFALSGATGTNLNDIVGTGSTWKVSKAGALTVASCSGCGGGTLQADYNSSTPTEITLNTTNNGLTIVNTASDAISGNLLEVGNNAANTFYLGVTKSGSSFNANAVTSGTGLSVSATGLTTGNGLLVTGGDPKTNNNAGVLTSGKLINVSSADHSYMSLDNRDLTVGGHKNNITLANVQNVFVYDTARDRDGGRWTGDERAVSSSWYNESGSAVSASPVAGSACIIGTNNRCGIAAFPDKVILAVAGAAGANTLYIFDAKDNSLWMAFNQGTSAALGANANNILSSVYALNGNIYVGTNGSAASGAYEINFKADRITRYNSTDAEDFALGPISSRNASSGTAYVNQNRTGVKLVSNTVQSVFAQIISGKTYFLTTNGNATAANGGITAISETNQSVANYGPANENYQSVFYTADDIIYGLSSTSSSLDAWYSASTLSGNNIAKSTNYSATTIPALWPTAPTISTSAPNALFVTNGTSDADGQSNTMYVGFNQGMTGIEEKVGDETGGAIKYYTTNSISEEMFGDVRTMLPMAGTASVATNTTLSGADLDVSVKAANFTTHGTNAVTRISGVRGKGMTFDGTNYLCTGTTTTCANNANVDVAQTNFSLSFWVKTASATTTRLLANKQATPGQVSAATAGYYVGINASHQLTSTVTDGTTYVTATSTRILDDNNWHFVSITMNRPTTGAACSATNTCTLSQYIDGITDGTATSTAMANSMTNTTQLALMATSTGASFTTGSMDEFTFTARTLTSSQIQFMNNVGARALNNPNHTGASSIRGASVTQDQANALNGSNAVKAINPLLDNGLIYIGTSGGVSIVGMYTDTLTDLYSTAITTKDDVATNYDTVNGNAVNSISVSKGFGMGVLLGIGFNNAGTGGLWAESNDTTFKDFLTSPYNPFGNTLVQTNLIADRVFRVTNQLSTRLDNFSIAGSAQPQIADLFKVDNNGAVIQIPTEVIDTNASGTVPFRGLTINSLNNVTQSGAGTTDIRGIDQTLPNITQTAGTLTAVGANIKTGTITTNGTETGINIDMSASTITTNGTLVGLKISQPTTAQAVGTTQAISLGTSTGSVANTIDSATIAVGNKLSTDTNNRTTLNIQNGGTGFFDLELIRGMINFQQTNWFDEEFNGKALDTTNKVNNATPGTGATCAIPASTTNLGGQYQMTTGTTTGATAGCTLSTLATLTNGFYERGNNPVYETSVKMQSTANTVRAYFGFAAAVPTSDANTGNHAFIEKQAADTTWRCSVANGTTETTAVITGATISTTAFQRLRVAVMSGTTPEVVCSVDNNSVAVTATIPTATTALDWIARAEGTGTSTGPHAVDYVRTWQDDPPLTPDIATSTNNSGLDVSAPTASESAQVATSLADNPTPQPLVLNSNSEGQVVIKDKDGNNSIVFDDNGNAVFKGIITADKIKANQIEGLEILTSKISALGEGVGSMSAVLAAQDQILQSELASQSAPLAQAQSPSMLTLTSLNVDGLATISANLRVKGNGLIEGILNIADTLTTRDLIVSKIAEFLGDVIFRGNVDFFGSVKYLSDITFHGRPTFNSDTAGFAVIRKGADRVEVTFDKEYENTPIINASLVFDQTKLADGKIEDPKILEKKVFAGGYTYIVSSRTAKGFTITLNKQTLGDITFSWIAMAVKDAKSFESAAVISTPTSVPISPISTQSAVIISTPTPTITIPLPTSEATTSAGQ